MEYVPQICKLPETHSAFLFGARGTGKTTLLHQTCQENSTVFIDLLDLEQETEFRRDPGRFGRLLDGLASKIQTVVVDEIQRVPRLLDVIHLKLEERKRKKINSETQPYPHSPEIPNSYSCHIMGPLIVYWTISKREIRKSWMIFS